MTIQQNFPDREDELARLVAALERTARELDARAAPSATRTFDFWHGGDREDPDAGGVPAGSAGGYPPDASEDRRAYLRWLDLHGEPSGVGSPGADSRRTPVTRRPRRGTPQFTVLVAAAGTPTEFLERCVGSIFAQSFAKWELIVVCDLSDASAADCVGSLRRVDRRVRVVPTGDGSGVDAVNEAVRGAKGEFVAFVAARDELSKDALADVAAAIAESPDADVVYTDEDRIDPVGERFAPILKPAWSPDYLLDCDYVGRLVVIRRALFVDLGGLRPGFDSAAEYDLVLRATERARRIEHVTGVAYHRRQAVATELGGPGAADATRRVIADALVRRGSPATIEDGVIAGHHNVRHGFARLPLVSIIIPFRDEPALTAKCVTSIRARPGYEHLEIVLVDNESELPESRALVERLVAEPGVRLVDAPGPFNWSAINNAAVRTCDGELLLFMNNDIEARKPHWLDPLVGHALRPVVGAVGARLVYPDGSLQHGGVVFGLGGLAAHVLRGLPGDRPGYGAMAVETRDCSAVTGACMMVRREVFDSIGGFDEKLSVSFNDVDFCLKLREAGYLVVYTPLTELVHHESRSRGHTEDSPAHRRILDRWGTTLASGDPYYNDLLSKWRDWCPISTVQEDERWTNFLTTTLSTPDPSSSS